MTKNTVDYELELLDINYQDYLVKREVPYYEVDDELEDMRIHLNSGENMLQVGLQGSGKTRSCYKFAYEHEIPIVELDCTMDIKEKKIKIKPWVVTENGDKKAVYIAGHFVVAIQLANKFGSAVLLLEELNNLPPRYQKMLNSISDWRESFTIPEINHEFELEPDSNLLVTGTMNPHGTGGTHLINRDLDSRFSKKDRGYPSEEDMVSILKVSGIPDTIGSNRNVRSKLSTFFHMISSNYDSGQLESMLSPREIVTMGRLWVEYEQEYQGPKDPIEKVIELKVESTFTNDEFNNIVNEWIRNTFNIPY